MRHTEWKEHTEGGRKYRIRAEYGFHTSGSQAPYWSVTATIERWTGRRWEDDSGGCLHDEVREHFPQLAPTLRWHLSSVPGGPMHYAANARYWLEKVEGVGKWPAQSYDPDPSKAFASTVVLGAVEGERVPTIATLGEWLEARHPAMMEAFRRDIDALDASLWPQQ